MFRARGYVKNEDLKPRFETVGETKRIARNTLAFMAEEQGVAKVRLYETTIASAIYFKNGVKGIELNSGGHKTNTTKDRINQVLSGTDYYVMQEDYQWYVVNRESDNRVKFEDHMHITIDQDPNELIMNS